MNARANGAGFVVALPAEARALIGASARAGELRSFGDGAWLAVCGVGETAARRAAQQLVAANVIALVSWGTAGGLDPQLGAGDIVLPQHVVDAGGAVWHIDERWHRRLQRALHGCGRVVGGSLLGSTVLLGSRGAKREAFTRTGAAAVDMESAAVATVAAEHGLPFVAVRVIVDAADQALPRAVAVALDAGGRAQPARLCAALARRPQDLLGLLRLAWRFALARRAMTRAARALGPALRNPRTGAAA
ncbi:MAG: phosphorylase [Gammaproteobacteria bacterium]|nr:phosphorylase [Gammaproteobacteria bacterium]